MEHGEERHVGTTQNVKFFPVLLLLGHVTSVATRWRSFLQNGYGIRGRINDVTVLETALADANELKGLKGWRPPSQHAVEPCRGLVHDGPHRWDWRPAVEGP